LKRFKGDYSSTRSIQTSSARGTLCTRAAWACRTTRSFHPPGELVCDSPHKARCGGHLEVRTAWPCRGRIEMVSSAPNHDSRNSRQRLCGLRTGRRAGLGGNRRIASKRHGSQHFSKWSRAPADDGSRRKPRRDVLRSEEIWFSNGQSGLALSTWPWCGRLRNLQPFHPRALRPCARGILRGAGRRGTRCNCDLRNGRA